MNITKKLAIGVALLGAATVANAQQMTFGASVPPIMSVEAIGAVLPAAALLSGQTAVKAPDGDSPTVGFVQVTTNLPTWNLKITAKNKGVLKSLSNVGLATNGVTSTGETIAGELGQFNDNDGSTTESIFLCPTSLNETPITACAKIEAGIPAGADPAVPSVPTNADDVFASVPPNGFSGSCSLEGNCFIANDDDATTPEDAVSAIKTTLTFDVKTHIGGTEVTALAGLYLETLYLSLTGTF